MPQRLKRVHCPIHCTFIVRKCFSLWSPTNTAWRPQYRIDSQRRIEKAPSCLRECHYENDNQDLRGAGVCTSLHHVHTIPANSFCPGGYAESDDRSLNI